MGDNYQIKIACIVLSTDIPKNKQYVLSVNKDEIEFPVFDINNEFLENPTSYIVKHLKQLMFISDIELISQLISVRNSLDSTNLPYMGETSEIAPKQIYLTYGLVTPKSMNISDDVNWTEFHYQIPNKYSHILLEVTQKIQ